ncbi:MAG: HAMP domain-containing histidine kinase [Ruminococcus sp.]|nr:HAMP domain-containing histidine kinase [Ruminococcus sp.]
MNKGKSIFSKYFVICSAVILISFVCLGAVLLLVSSRYFIEDRKALLKKNCEGAAHEVCQVMLDDPSEWKGQASEIMKEYAMGCNAHFILTDKNGRVIEKTYGSDETIGAEVSDDLLGEIDENGYYVYDNFGGLSNETSHVCGVKFAANGPDYYMLTSAATSDDSDYVANLLEVFGISAVIVLVIALFIVYFATMKLTEPVKEIATLSKKIGKGDFDVKFPEYDIAEFKQLSNAFNEMAASLKSYDTMRNSFVANVSHELRTPMTSIGGFVDGLLDGTIPEVKRDEYLRIISSEVHRLTRLVRSMLNLAKIEAGEMEPKLEKFSVIELIVETLMTFENRIEEKQIEIRGLDAPRIWLYADEGLVHQVIYNLIENAIKFVNKGGYIQFGFEPIGDRTVISIRNSGEGLSEEEMPLVFDRFYKTDKSRGLDATGVGLGLNIVSSIIRLHGGKIMVKSVKGEYTEFVFTLANSEP